MTTKKFGGHSIVATTTKLHGKRERNKLMRWEGGNEEKTTEGKQLLWIFWYTLSSTCVYMYCPVSIYYTAKSFEHEKNEKKCSTMAAASTATTATTTKSANNKITSTKWRQKYSDIIGNKSGKRWQWQPISFSLRTKASAHDAAHTHREKKKESLSHHYWILFFWADTFLFSSPKK